MSIAEIAARIGSSATLATEAFLVPVEVKDAKQSYGRVRYLVTPVGGAGEAWVDTDRLSWKEVVA